MSVTGEPGGPPVKVGVPLTDLGAGLFALSAILAALHYRHRTGRGQYIDTSLVEAGIALSVWESAEYLRQRRARPSRWDRRTACSRRIRRSAAPTATSRWRRQRSPVSAAVRRARAPGVDGGSGFRRTTRAASATARRSPSGSRRSPGRAARALAGARSTPRGIPCGPINNYAEALRRSAGPRARDGRRDRPSDARPRPRTLGSPIKMSETPPVVGRRAPLLGEHTREVLREAGLQRE